MSPRAFLLHPTVYRMWCIFFLLLSFYFAYITLQNLSVDEQPTAGPSNTDEALFELPPTSSGRAHRFPGKYGPWSNFAVSSVTPVPHMPPPLPSAAQLKRAAPISPSPPPSPPPSEPGPSTEYRTEPDDFGVYRVYSAKPTHIPHHLDGLDARCVPDAFPTLASNVSRQSWWTAFSSTEQCMTERAHRELLAPFLNATVFRLMHWVYTGSTTKSIPKINRLVHEVILVDDFDHEHLRGFHAKKETARLDGFLSSGGEPGPSDSHKRKRPTRLNDDEPAPATTPAPPGNGWRQMSVFIPLPHTGTQHDSEMDAPVFEVTGVWVRSLVEIVRAVFSSPAALDFHLAPFRLFWKDPDDPSVPTEALYSEIYDSEAMNEEHDKIRATQAEIGDEYESVVAAGLWYSDSSHLANFGLAALWPIYFFFGNLSKHLRSQADWFAAHHLAYIPTVRTLLLTL